MMADAEMQGFGSASAPAVFLSESLFKFHKQKLASLRVQACHEDV
jgi:hypothetical protein